MLSLMQWRQEILGLVVGMIELERYSEGLKTVSESPRGSEQGKVQRKVLRAELDAIEKDEYFDLGRQLTSSNRAKLLLNRK